MSPYIFHKSIKIVKSVINFSNKANHPLPLQKLSRRGSIISSVIEDFPLLEGVRRIRRLVSLRLQVLFKKKIIL
jgi:hypothetical protein